MRRRDDPLEKLNELTEPIEVLDAVLPSPFEPGEVIPIVETDPVQQEQVGVDEQAVGCMAEDKGLGVFHEVRPGVSSSI